MTIDPQAWREFRRGTLAPEARRTILRSVLTDDGFEDALERAEQPMIADDYSAAFDYGLASALKRQSARARDAESVASRARFLESRLSAESPDGLANEVAGEPAAWRRRLAAYLRVRSLKVGFRDAVASVALARLAVAILALPEADSTDPDADADADDSDDDLAVATRWRQARAAAWAQLGNALRVASDLREADQAITVAVSMLDRETDPPEVQAGVLSLAGSLRSDQSRFGEAKDFCRRALRQARQGGDRGLEIRVTLKLASQHAYCAEHESAITVLQRAQARIDEQREPRLALVAAHNLASYLNEAGRPEEAWDRLRDVRRQAEAIDNELDLLRLGWLEGRVLLARGHEQEGLDALMKARSAFLDRDMAYEMAQVSLELAAHHAARGSFAEVRRLAGELVPVFAARDVHREARAALEVFVEAVRSETVERGLIIQIASFLDRARERPDLRFHPTTVSGD